MTNEGFTKIVNFIVSGDEDHGWIYQNCTFHSLAIEGRNSYASAGS